MIFRYTSIFRGYRIKSTGVIWEQQKNSLQIKKNQSFQIQKDRFVETIKESTIKDSQGPKKHFVQVFCCGWESPLIYIYGYSTLPKTTFILVQSTLFS